MNRALETPPAWALRPELRERLKRLEHLEQRERENRYARWHVPAPTEREQDGWLLTYLDLVTLLLVMLVVMLAFSTPGGAADDAVAAPAVVPETTHLETQSESEPTHELLDNAPPLPLAEVVSLTDEHHTPPVAANEPGEPEPVVDLAVALPDAKADVNDAPPATPDTDTVLAAPSDVPATLSGLDDDAPYLAQAEPAYQEPRRLVGSIARLGETATPRFELPAPAVENPLWRLEMTLPGEAGTLSAHNEEPEHPVKPVAALPSLDELGLAELGDGIDVIINEESVSFRISNEILFASGQVALTASGLAVLDRLVAVLHRNEYQISVEGHTDPIPIQNERFPSNWELSTSRATSVLRHLEAQGIARERLRATGYADTRPIAGNDNAAGRAVNRRVELIMETHPVEKGSGSN